MSLRRHSSSAFRFNSEIMASRKIILDLETFQTFFDSYAEELRRGGLKSNSNSSSKPTAHVAGIVRTIPSISLYIVSYLFSKLKCTEYSQLLNCFICSTGNSAAAEELEPIANLARIVSAAHMTGTCN